MSELLRCGCCGTHVRVAGQSCPFCGCDKASKVANTASVALLGLALSGCIIVNPQPKYGIANTGEDTFGESIADDADSDGYPVPADCNDQDPNVNPAATETPGDGIDSNCDGQDDT